MCQTDEVDLSTRPRASARPTHFWEARLAFAFAVIFPAIVVADATVECLIRWVDNPYSRNPWLLTIGVFVVAVLEALTCWFLNRRWERLVKISLEDVAREQLAWPISLRPIVALWWLSHSIAAILAVGCFSDMLREMEQYRPWYVAHLFPYAARLAAAFASNAYILLTVAALLPDRELVRMTWKMRILIDLLLTYIFASVPLPLFS